MIIKWKLISVSMWQLVYNLGYTVMVAKLRLFEWLNVLTPNAQ